LEIGLLFSTTGPYAALGRNALDGVRMAMAGLYPALAFAVTALKRLRAFAMAARPFARARLLERRA
jgi:hypothetical protein